MGFVGILPSFTATAHFSQYPADQSASSLRTTNGYIVHYEQSQLQHQLHMHWATLYLLLLLIFTDHVCFRQSMEPAEAPRLQKAQANLVLNSSEVLLSV